MVGGLRKTFVFEDGLTYSEAAIKSDLLMIEMIGGGNPSHADLKDKLNFRWDQDTEKGNVFRIWW